MTKTFKLFSLMFSLFFSLIFAVSDIAPILNLDSYRLYVTQVDTDARCFSLSNGLLFNAIKKEWVNRDLPEVGTEIYLMPKLRHSRSHGEKVIDGEFYASYFEGVKKRNLLVWMMPESRRTSLSYVSTVSECVRPASWPFAEVVRYVIELSDGSKWIADKAPSNFNPGNSVILTPDMESEKWHLINISEENFMETNRMTLAYYEQVEVTPYKGDGEVSKDLPESNPYAQDHGGF